MTTRKGVRGTSRTQHKPQTNALGPCFTEKPTQHTPWFHYWYSKSYKNGLFWKVENTPSGRRTFGMVLKWSYAGKIPEKQNPNKNFQLCEKLYPKKTWF